MTIDELYATHPQLYAAEHDAEHRLEYGSASSTC